MFEIFDQPWTILCFSIILMGVFWTINAVKPTEHRWWQFIIPLLVALVGFGLDHFVQTDREKIASVITAAVKAIEEESPGRLAVTLSNDYKDSFHRDKDAILNNFESKLESELFKKINLRILSLEISDNSNSALARVSARVIFGEGSFVAKTYKAIFDTVLEMKLSKSSNQWVITAVELQTVDRQSMKWNDVMSVRW
jgi:hypothetical protein